MIDYNKLKIKPGMTIDKAFKTIIKYCEPRLNVKGINKIFDLVMTDRECRIALLSIITKSLEVQGYIIDGVTYRI